MRNSYSHILSFRQYADNKSFCEDLTEGKFSFPIVHAIKTFPNDQAILSKSLMNFPWPWVISIFLLKLIFKGILRLKTTKDEIKRFAVNHLEKLGSFAYTVKTLQEIRNETMKEIERLGGNPYLVEIMNYLYIEKKNVKKST